MILGVLLCGAAAGVATWLVPVDRLLILVPIIAVAALIALGLATWVAVKLASKIELSALINSPSPLGGEVQTATPAPPAQPAADSAVPTGSPVRVTEDDIAYGKPYPGMVTVAAPPGSPPAIAAAADGVHTTTPDSAPPATQSPVAAAPVFDRVDTAVPSEALPGWVYTDEADNWYLVTSVPDGHRLLRLSDFTIAPVNSAAGRLTLAGSVEMTVWPANPDEPDTQEHEVVAEEDGPTSPAPS
ncbi:MAG: hypothetical protein ACRD0P_06045 [Stackebrandtia sp.]